ncbi:hypothetical protein [Streptomyces globisporus]|uniref:hypothetical protein n=1 Tax=Streptomyces globisporus TaxID=1908 RepID=UPI00369E5612
MDRFAAPANLVPSAAAPAEPQCRGVPVPLRTRHVPFIAVTAGEGGLDIPRLAKRTDGWVQYETPGPYDRYPDTDVLLARTRGAVPSGLPDGTVLCPYRHAHCMLNRRCQGCGEPAERGPQGVLWVLPATRADSGPGATSGFSDMPPSCARCALHGCPVLAARGRKLLWVAEAEVVGVYAEVFPPGGGRVSDAFVRFNGERTLSAAVATRYVCDLQRVSEADPASIAELARRPRAAVTYGAGGPALTQLVRIRPESAAVAGRTA